MPTSTLHVRMLDAAGDRTFRALSAVTGVNHETVRRYMQGATPSVEFIAAFCEGLGLNANWLLTGQGPMKASEIKPDALLSANPTDLLTATAGNIEQLDERVDRLEVFVSTMESRVRAAVLRGADAPTEPADPGTPESETPHAPQDPAGPADDRARRIADALPERPREDDR